MATENFPVLPCEQARNFTRKQMFMKIGCQGVIHVQLNILHDSKVQHAWFNDSSLQMMCEILRNPLFIRSEQKAALKYIGKARKLGDVEYVQRGDLMLAYKFQPMEAKDTILVRRQHAVPVEDCLAGLGGTYESWKLFGEKILVTACRLSCAEALSTGFERIDISSTPSVEKSEYFKQVRNHSASTIRKRRALKNVSSHRRGRRGCDVEVPQVAGTAPPRAPNASSSTSDVSLETACSSGPDSRIGNQGFQSLVAGFQHPSSKPVSQNARPSLPASCDVVGRGYKGHSLDHAIEASMHESADVPTSEGLCKGHDQRRDEITSKPAEAEAPSCTWGGLNDNGYRNLSEAVIQNDIDVYVKCEHLSGDSDCQGSEVGYCIKEHADLQDRNPDGLLSGSAVPPEMEADSVGLSAAGTKRESSILKKVSRSTTGPLVATCVENRRGKTKKNCLVEASTEVPNPTDVTVSQNANSKAHGVRLSRKDHGLCRRKLSDTDNGNGIPFLCNEDGPPPVKLERLYSEDKGDCAETSKQLLNFMHSVDDDDFADLGIANRLRVGRRKISKRGRPSRKTENV